MWQNWEQMTYYIHWQVDIWISGIQIWSYTRLYLQYICPPDESHPLGVGVMVDHVSAGMVFPESTSRPRPNPLRWDFTLQHTSGKIHTSGPRNTCKTTVSTRDAQERKTASVTVFQTKSNLMFTESWTQQKTCERNYVQSRRRNTPWQHI